MHTDPSPNDLPIAMEHDSPYASPVVDAAEVASGPRSEAGLAIAALILPLIAGSLLFFVESLALSLLISLTTTVTTAVLLAVDAYRLGRTTSAARQPDSPAALLLGIILIWIVVYPLAFFRRSRIGGPHLGLPAIGVALFFAAGPLVQALLRPAELPSCTDPMVVDLVEKTLRGTPDGASIESISGHREVRYDPTSKVRVGGCIVHLPDEDLSLSYVVQWQDRERGAFQVRILDK